MINKKNKTIKKNKTVKKNKTIKKHKLKNLKYNNNTKSFNYVLRGGDYTLLPEKHKLYLLYCKEIARCENKKKQSILLKPSEKLICNRYIEFLLKYLKEFAYQSLIDCINERNENEKQKKNNNYTVNTKYSNNTIYYNKNNNTIIENELKPILDSIFQYNENIFVEGELINGINLLNIKSFKIINFFEDMNSINVKSNYDTIDCSKILDKIHYIEIPFILVILGNLTLDDIIESLFNNFYLIAVISKPIKADGITMSPLKFMEHDFEHAILSKNELFTIEYNEFNKSTKENLSTFYYKLQELTKSKFKFDKIILDSYESVKIVLFLLMHEHPEHYYVLDNFNNIQKTNQELITIIFNSLIPFDLRYDKNNNLGSFIEKPYDILQKLDLNTRLNFNNKNFPTTESFLKKISKEFVELYIAFLTKTGIFLD